MASIYLHIPFCKRFCAYCDFYKSARLELLQPVVEAMLRELDARLGELDGEPLRTLYFGGGTPRSARQRRCSASSTASSSGAPTPSSRR